MLLRFSWLLVFARNIPWNSTETKIVVQLPNKCRDEENINFETPLKISVLASCYSFAIFSWITLSTPLVPALVLC